MNWLTGFLLHNNNNHSLVKIIVKFLLWIKHQVTFVVAANVEFHYTVFKTMQLQCEYHNEHENTALNLHTSLAGQVRWQFPDGRCNFRLLFCLHWYSSHVAYCLFVCFLQNTASESAFLSTTMSLAASTKTSSATEHNGKLCKQLVTLL